MAHERTYAQRPLRELFEQPIVDRWTLIGKGPSVDAWLASETYKRSVTCRLGINEVARYIDCYFAVWIDGKVGRADTFPPTVISIRAQGEKADWSWNGVDDLPGHRMGKTGTNALLVIGEWAKRRETRVHVAMVGFDAVDQPVWTRPTLYAKLFDDITEPRTVDLTRHAQEIVAVAKAYSEWLEIQWWHRICQAYHPCCPSPPKPSKT